VPLGRDAPSGQLDLEGSRVRLHVNCVTPWAMARREVLEASTDEPRASEDKEEYVAKPTAWLPNAVSSIEGKAIVTRYGNMEIRCAELCATFPQTRHSSCQNNVCEPALATFKGCIATVPFENTGKLIDRVTGVN
jgi:hypothetical protein